MGNMLSFVVLFSWPLIAIYIAKKMPRQDAAILLLLIPLLFLPERVGMDLPGIPPLDKGSIPALMVLFIWMFGKDKIKFFSLPKDRILKLLVILLFLHPIGTWLSNTNGYYVGPRYLPGLTFDDLVSMEFNSLCRTFVPFVVGWKILNTQESHQKILKYFLVFGLGYSLLMLWEIRMSPQLHNTVYGFFPHSFSQQIREGGFRPVVFTSHGLVLAMLCAYWVIISAALYRAKDAALKNRGFWIMLYLFVVLVLCKTLGALVLTLIFMPCVLFLNTRKQLKIAAVLAYIVLFYPMLRTEGLIPINGIADLAKSYNEDRAGSLIVRINNEEMLLELAAEKKYFGWGGWGRNRIYDERSGRDITITDGFWIIVVGIFGWAGYLSIFGLLTYPIISLWRCVKKGGMEVSIYSSCIVVIAIMNLIDLLPNSSISSLTLMLVGAIYGLKEKLAQGDDPKLQTKSIA